MDPEEKLYSLHLKPQLHYANGMDKPTEVEFQATENETGCSVLDGSISSALPPPSHLALHSSRSLLELTRVSA
jgi:hypothetical protein